MLSKTLSKIREWFLKKLADKNSPEQANQKKFCEYREYRKNLTTLTKKSFRSLKFLFKGKHKKFLQNAFWYVVLGEKSSGKSILLRQSELEFSYFDEVSARLKTVNDFGWYFGKNLVFVEVPQNSSRVEAFDDVYHDTTTANNAATAAATIADKTSDANSFAIKAKSNWLALICLLRRYRRRLPPLNGVIVTVDLLDFLSKDSLQIQNCALAIKENVKELSQRFKQKIPVYLVFTKCDLIAGFGEFFNVLTTEERKQIFGITMPLDFACNNKNVAAFLANEFDRLIVRLDAKTLSHLATESNLKRRELILCFSQQLLLCKHAINKFVVQALTADDNEGNNDDGGNSSDKKNLADNQSGKLQFRGFYFTSGQQSGKPQNVLMSVMEEKLGLEKAHLSEQLFNTQSYFIAKLFKDLIIDEKELVGDVLQRRVRRHRTIYALMFAFFVGGISGVWLSYQRNLVGIEQANDQVDYYQQLTSKLPAQNLRFVDVLPALNALQEVMPVYKNIAQNELLLFGSGTPFIVESAVKNALFHKLQTIFIPSLKSYLEKQIYKDIADGKLYDLYNDLKGYLAFNLNDKIAPFWIEPPLFTGLEKDSALKLNSVEKQLLKNFIALTVQTGFKKQELNIQLVTAARNKLRQISLARRAYWYLQEKNLFDKQKDTDLNDKIGGVLSEVFDNIEQMPMIPAFFSTTGFEYLYRKSDKQAIEEIASSDLVMGINHVRLSSAEKQHMSAELRDIYAHEYYRHWQEPLNQLRVAQFKDLEHAINVLDILINTTSSPIFKLIDLVNFNTKPLIHANLETNQFFKALNLVAEQQGTEYVQLTEVNKTLVKLRDFIAKIASEPNPRAAHQVGISLINGAIKGDPITQLYKQAQSLPEPLGRWYEEIAQNSLKAILQAALQVINNNWKAGVFEEYQENLIGRYPFDPNANAEVSLENFSHFFAPQGTFDAFYQKELVDFVDKHGRGGESLKSLFGQNIGISAKMFAQISKMVNIRDKYFIEGSKQPSLKFVIKPVTLSEQAARVELHLGQQFLSYAHGPRRGYAWQWPSSGSVQDAGVTFSLFSGSAPSSAYTGNWAWFRLLANANLHSEDTSDSYYFSVGATGENFAKFEIISPVSLEALNLEWFTNLVLNEHL